MRFHAYAPECLSQSGESNVGKYSQRRSTIPGATRAAQPTIFHTVSLRDTTSVRQSVRAALRPRPRVVLAVSGGLDSMVLLDAAAATVPRGQLVVATFDHGTGTAATAALDLVRRCCALLGIEFVGGRAAGPLESEAELRDARWSFLREVAAACSRRRIDGAQRGRSGRNGADARAPRCWRARARRLVRRERDRSAAHPVDASRPGALRPGPGACAGSKTPRMDHRAICGTACGMISCLRCATFGSESMPTCSRSPERRRGGGPTSKRT